MSFLSRHADPSLEVPQQEVDGWSSVTWAAEEIAKAEIAVATLSYAGTVPRRLGDVEAGSLARDKQLIRRMEWVMRQTLKIWGGKPDALNVDTTAEELRRLAVTMLAPHWLEQRVEYVTERRAYVATVCMRNGNRKLGNTFCQRYTTELSQLQWTDR